jgi:hypothetical protein
VNGRKAGAGEGGAEGEDVEVGEGHFL